MANNTGKLAGAGAAAGPWGAAIGAGAGAIMDIAQANRNKKRAKEMAVFNREQQMKFWEDTNYPAQVEQMKKAGLNIGLMYEGGGQTGQTTGANAETPMEGSAGTAMGIQAMLQAAQVENLKADAKLKEVEAVKKGGADTENVMADTASKQQQVRMEQPREKYAESRAQSEAIQKDEDWRKTEWENRMSRDAYNYKLAKLKAEQLNEEQRTKILKAEEEVKEFEASMAREGIPPNSPWYAKLLGDLLIKMGIMDWLQLGKAVTKEAIKPK